MKRAVYKYGTGDAVPEGAVYLSTVTQTSLFIPGHEFTEISGPTTGRSGRTDDRWESCWLVWHYFLVEVPE